MSVSVPIATARVRHAATNFVRQLCLISAFSFFPFFFFALYAVINEPINRKWGVLSVCCGLRCFVSMHLAERCSILWQERLKYPVCFHFNHPHQHIWTVCTFLPCTGKLTTTPNESHSLMELIQLCIIKINSAVTLRSVARKKRKEKKKSSFHELWRTECDLST